MKGYFHNLVRLSGTLILLMFLTVSTRSQANISTAAEKREAEKAWEALIRAKGGREKLYSVTNMVTQFGDVTRFQLFPCSRWEFGRWLDMRLFLEVYDDEKKLRVVAGANGPERVYSKDLVEDCWYDQIPFLLETKWRKPTPLRVTREKAGKNQMDVIETMNGKWQVDFVYEPEDMLVTEVRFLFEDGTPYQKYRFSDYVDINGIKMPSTFN
ncbi:MAG: hypothetical protein ABIO36_09385, partial [Pyrinomonadaceae bacterium]